MIGNSKGSIYIYVTIIGIVVFLMMIFIISITRKDVQLSKASDSNLYHNAESGVSTALDLLNAQLSYIKDEAYKLTFEEFKTMPIYDIASYKIIPAENKYNGRFVLKNSYSDKFNELFINNAFVLLNTRMDDLASGFKLKWNGSNYSFQYKVNSYFVYVEITPESATKSYEIKAYSINKEKNKRDTVRASIKFSTSNFSSEIIESYSVSSVPEIYKLGSVVENLSSSNNLINEYVDLNSFASYDPLCPIYIYNGNAIDISSFYFNDLPVTTAIINNTNQPMEIYATDIYKSNFEGVIVSAAEIHIHDSVTQISGSVISYNSITIPDSTILSNMPDALTNIIFLDNSLRRRFLDLVGVTKFYEITGDETDIVEGVANISSLNIYEGDEINLYIKTWKEAYN